jgi:tRNA1(Val) A37 N6-methylase TrmN6
LALTTIDGLLGGRVALEQPATGFRASIDAVLLAAAVEARPAGRVLDAGCGTGAAALCLAWRRPDLSIIGLEIDPLAAGLARANVDRNDRTAWVSVECGDLMPPPAALLQPFDTVMTNPPFNAPAGATALDPGRAVAMVDALGPAPWLGACLGRLAPGGRLVLVHRADRLPAVLAALDVGAGAIEIIPLWPGPDARPAKRVILRCRKGARGPAILRRGLVLHGRTGMFSEAAEAILRHGAALDDVLEAG